MKPINQILCTTVMAALVQGTPRAVAEVTAFSYQGLLTQGGNPAVGPYDLQFALYDDPALGSQVGLAVTNRNVAVNKGVFITDIDVGTAPFNGQPRWLNIGVRPGGSTALFQPLFPRQAIQASPYSLRAVNAASATTMPWSGLTGLPPGFADGVDNDTLYSAGTGLSLVGTNFSLANGGVGTTQLANGAVTALKLANGAALAEITDNDGSGSGLDADLLDGQDSTAFAPRNNPTFTGRLTAAQLEVTGSASLKGSLADGGLTVHAFGGISAGTTNKFFSSPGSFFIDMSVNVDGDLQVSRSTNAFRFDVNADGNLELWRMRLRTNGASGSLMMLVTTNGEVGIGTIGPQFLLHVDGSAGKPGGGSWSVASDVRLKKNVQALRGALDQLLALHGVTFEYNDPKAVHELAGQRTGLIAQEVEKVLPDWVETGPDGYKRLTVRGFEALVVEALRELRAEKQSRIESLEKNVSELKGMVSALMEQSKSRGR